MFATLVQYKFVDMMCTTIKSRFVIPYICNTMCKGVDQHLTAFTTHSRTASNQSLLSCFLAIISQSISHKTFMCLQEHLTWIIWAGKQLQGGPKNTHSRKCLAVFESEWAKIKPHVPEIIGTLGLMRFHYLFVSKKMPNNVVKPRRSIRVN